MNRSVALLVSSIALATAFVATEPPAAYAAGARATARAAELYRQATRLYSARRLTEAEPLYQEAWELQQSYDIASNYGALELELDKPRRAAELLSFALSQFPVNGAGTQRAALEDRLTRAKQRVGALRIKSDVAGAEIRVDGQTVGRAPLPAEIFVDPGSRVVEATFTGYVATKLTLVVKGGEVLDVRLPLSPPPAPPPPPKRSMKPAIAGGAVALASAATGTALYFAGDAKRREALRLHDSIQAAGANCAGTYPGCADLRAATAGADRLGNAGIALLGIAGTVAVGSVVYALWPSSSPGKKELDVRASLAVTPTGGAAALTGSF